jgi:micrococcal nuclease
MLATVQAVEAQPPSAVEPPPDTALVEPSVGGSASCTVARIIDGDTFVCAGGSRIRLILIDADERGQSVHADSATALVERLMPPGARVRLDFDVELYDRYRRVLAYVHTDSAFVNLELVRRGLARVAVYPPNVGMVDRIRAAADSARAERLGVWGESVLECTPADYRAGRCGRSPSHVAAGQASLHGKGGWTLGGHWEGWTKKRLVALCAVRDGPYADGPVRRLVPFA